MAMQLDPRIEAIRKQYDLRQDDFWKLPQGRDTWLAKHAALEVVAAKAGIIFERPDITETDAANKIAVIVVGGKLGDRYEWSFGEAAPYNNKNSYPYAMAEKRAKDRVVLKLIGLHGLVYSEEESDDFKEQPAAPQKPVTASKNDDARNLYSTLETAMRMATTKAELRTWWQNPTNVTARNRLPSDWQGTLREESIKLANELPEGHQEQAA